MSSQGSSPIRISCPHCDGKVKVPTIEPGQRYQCPRCSGEIVVGGPPPEVSDVADEQASAAAPAADDETLQPRLPGSKPDDGQYGITCQVCRTRLHVKPTQIGTTIKCPDCYSPVTVTGPTKRTQHWQAAPGNWDDGEDLVGGPTAMEVVAEKRLAKARAEQDEEEAAERDASAERFTEGLFAFFIDPHALVRLAILTIWFKFAVVLFQSAPQTGYSEDTPSIVGQAAGVVFVVVVGFLLLTFMYAAACGLALVRDTSAGLRKIEHWPGIDFRAWGRDVFFIVNAGIFAALPGAFLGVALGIVGIPTGPLFPAAATFGAMFPPMLLSMFQSKSVFAPFSKEAWNSIARRRDPWKLSYLITTLVIIAGLFALVFCLCSRQLLGLVLGFIFGLVCAAALVALIMIYFRTIGRLFGILAGRDVKPAARS